MPSNLSYSLPGQAFEDEFGAPRRIDPTILTARLALDYETQRDAFRLRHICYLNGGHIDARESGMFSDEFDDRLNCTTIVLYQLGRAVASARVCLLDTAGGGKIGHSLPAEHVFPDEVAELVAEVMARQGRCRAVEINRLVVHPDFGKDPTAIFGLFRMAGYMITEHETDLVFSCVRGNHMGMYRRLQFSNVAGPRTYHGVKFATNLQVCQRADYERVRLAFPILRTEPSSRTSFVRLLEGCAIPVFPQASDASPSKTRASTPAALPRGDGPPHAAMDTAS